MKFNRGDRVLVTYPGPYPMAIVRASGTITEWNETDGSGFGRVWLDKDPKAWIRHLHVDTRHVVPMKSPLIQALYPPTADPIPGVNKEAE